MCNGWKGPPRFDVGVGEREAEGQSSGERVGGYSGEMAETAPSEREDRNGTAVWGRAQEQRQGQGQGRKPLRRRRYVHHTPRHRRTSF